MIEIKKYLVENSLHSMSGLLGGGVQHAVKEKKCD